MVDYCLIGYGIVGRGVCEYLKGHIIVIDKIPVAVPARPGQRIEVIQAEVTEENFAGILERYSGKGTIVVETATSIETAQVVSWCHANGRHFVNTVADIWLTTTLEWSENYRRLDDLLARIVEPLFAIHEGARSGPTAVVMQGANTGMVNHYLKRAIREMAAHQGRPIAEVGRAVREVYVIEKDTLCFRPGFRPAPDVFYNTWNIKEFILESVARCEYPSGGSVELTKRALQRDVFLGGKMVKGRLVAHEETFTMAYYLKTTYGNDHAKVQFLYEASPIGVMSRMRYPFGYDYIERCVTFEVEEGYDLVGTLVVLDDGSAWFTGQQMENADARRFLAETNATAWYVSAGVLAAIEWIKADPNRGILFPEFADEAAVIRNFHRWCDPKAFQSYPVTGLVLSPEYPDIEIDNLYATGEKTYHP